MVHKTFLVLVSITSILFPNLCCAVSRSKQANISNIMKQAGSEKLHRNAYDRYYELILKDFRDRPDVRILEVSTNSANSLQVVPCCLIFEVDSVLSHLCPGAALLQMWATYFSDPGALHGVTKDPHEVCSDRVCVSVQFTFEQLRSYPHLCGIHRHPIRISARCRATQPFAEGGQMS